MRSSLNADAVYSSYMPHNWHKAVPFVACEYSDCVFHRIYLNAFFFSFTLKCIVMNKVCLSRLMSLISYGNNYATPLGFNNLIKGAFELEMFNFHKSYINQFVCRFFCKTNEVSILLQTHLPGSSVSTKYVLFWGKN